MARMTRAVRPPVADEDSGQDSSIRRRASGRAPGRRRVQGRRDHLDVAARAPACRLSAAGESSQSSPTPTTWRGGGPQDRRATEGRGGRRAARVPQCSRRGRAAASYTSCRHSSGFGPFDLAGAGRCARQSGTQRCTRGTWRAAFPVAARRRGQLIRWSSRSSKCMCASSSQGSATGGPSMISGRIAGDRWSPPAFRASA